MSPPERLTIVHNRASFDCGEPLLNDWLKRQALKNEEQGASRTYVVCAGETVMGYYCLATGAVMRDQAPKPLQRNMPDPIPVLVLGRLAVDLSFHGQGIGSALLKDAVVRSLNVAEIAGVKALLVHAISEEARLFYLARGFQESPIARMTLCLPLSQAKRALDSSS